MKLASNSVNYLFIEACLNLCQPSVCCKLLNNKNNYVELSRTAQLQLKNNVHPLVYVLASDCLMILIYSMYVHIAVVIVLSDLDDYYVK